MKSANEIVEKIRNNKPNGEQYKNPDINHQIDAVQKLMDEGLIVDVVNDPIVRYCGKRILLKTYIVSDEILYPLGTKAILIWSWYTISDKEFINIGYVYV